MIAIVDYEMGNLRSVQKAFEAVGHQAVLTSDPGVIQRASHVVLPGVGAFGDCMENLRRFELVDCLRTVIAEGTPFLGICLGLQVLFSQGEEFGVHQGLNIFKGTVKKFSFPHRHGTHLKIPHMGWNTIQVKQTSPVLQGLSSDAQVYFVHSFYVEPEDASVICTVTDYGFPFVSSVARKNVFACQFHPEKSQQVGLNILRNFGTWH